MPSRIARAISTITLAPLLVGCMTTFEFTPVPADAARAAVRDASEGRRTRVRDANGRARDVDEETAFAFGRAPEDLALVESNPLRPRDVTRLCKDAPASCPLNDPSLSWVVGEAHQHVVWDFIVFNLAVPVAIVGGLVAGNVACVAGDHCADSVKTAFIVTDVVLGAAVVITGIVVVATAGNWKTIGR